MGFLLPLFGLCAFRPNIASEAEVNPPKISTQQIHPQPLEPLVAIYCVQTQPNAHYISSWVPGFKPTKLKIT